MSGPIIVTIVGAPAGCNEGVKDSWRELAGWAAGKLRAKFGENVIVKYFDLFDPGCPSLSQGSQLPVVFVAGEMIASGGKISVPEIRKRIEALL